MYSLSLCSTSLLDYFLCFCYSHGGICNHLVSDLLHPSKTNTLHHTSASPQGRKNKQILLLLFGCMKCTLTLQICTHAINGITTVICTERTVCYALQENQMLKEQVDSLTRQLEKAKVMNAEDPKPAIPTTPKIQVWLGKLAARHTILAQAVFKLLHAAAIIANVQPGQQMRPVAALRNAESSSAGLAGGFGFAGKPRQGKAGTAAAANQTTALAN